MLKVLKFATVGVLNTIINYIVYCVLCYLGVHYLFSLAVAYAVAMTNSFLMNKSWTFSYKNKSTALQVSKFVAINVLSCLLNGVFLEIFVRLGVNIYLAQLIATAILLCLNFICYSSFIFKKPAI